MNTTWRALAVAVLAAFVEVSQARACACIDRGTERDQFDSACAVFVGKVVRLEVERVESGDGALEHTVATFEVKRSWKGLQAERIRVRTCGTQAVICSCSVGFLLGAEYLVVAYEEPLVTSSCDLTVEIESAGELIKKFDSFK